MSYIEDQATYDRLAAIPGLKEQYDCPGCYSLSLGDKIVYIGKSRNLFIRLVSHVYLTENPPELPHRYSVLHEAKKRGMDITFNILYIGHGETQKEIDDDIGFKEGELIRQHRPPLNIQIPKIDNYHSSVTNKKANTIALDEILADGGLQEAI
jgi:excinuclease UvrABC nuclease subunit